MRTFQLHISGGKIVAVVDPTEQYVLAAPGNPREVCPKPPPITGYGHRVTVQARNAIEALQTNPRGLRQSPPPSQESPKALWERAKRKLHRRRGLQTHFPEKLLPPASPFRSLLP